MFVRLLLVVSLCLPLAHASADPTAPPDGLRRNPPRSLALINVRLVPQPGELIESATIVIRDGRIVSINGDIPADATAIDLAGKTMYAGFIDAYAEAEVPDDEDLGENAHWNKNVVPQRSAATMTVDVEAHRKAGFVAAAFAPDAGIFRGELALRQTDEDAMTLATGLGIAARLTAERQSWDRPRVFPASPMGAVALARQTMYDAQWYRDAQAAVAEDATVGTVDQNDALAALQPVVNGKLPLWVRCDDELFVLRASKFGEEFDIDVVAIASGDEYRRAGLVGGTGVPLIVPVDFPKPPDVTSPAKADATDLQTLMAWDLAASNPKYLHELGMMMAWTTHGLDDPQDFLPNVRRAIARGLPKEAALRMLTSQAAAMTGVSDTLGTIEPGKFASFVLADDDLFDPEGEAKILEVWLQGERHELDAPPTGDVTGTWAVGDDTLTLTEDGGTWNDIDVANVTRTGDAVSFTVAEDDGVATVSLVLIGDTLRGTFASPDGTRRTVEATRTGDAPDEAEPDAKEAVEAAPAKTDGGTKEAADGVPTELQTGDGNPGTASAPSRDREGASDDSRTLESVPTTRPDQRSTTSPSPEGTTRPATLPGRSLTVAAPGDKAPLFEPNYPLGAYGRSATAEEGVRSLTHFTSATIWLSGEAGRTDRGTVSIYDGTIASVNDLDQGSEDAGFGPINIDPTTPVKTLDLAGKHITPGLIDAHSHIATDGGINEGTQAVTCEVRIGDFIDPDDIHLYRQLAGGVTTAQILHGSANPIGGQSEVIKFRWGQGPDAMKFDGAPEGVKWALGENVKQANWGDRFTTRYPQTRMGVQEVFEDSFRAALAYLQAQVDYEADGGMPVRRDLELDAVVEMMEGTRLIHCHSYRQDEVLATMRTLEKFGVTMKCFQHILEGYKVAPELAAHGATASAFSDWWAFKFEVYDAIPYNGSIMHDAGVVTSFNSDDAELATRLNTEAAKAVKYGGVDEVEALKFVTLNPAIQLGIDNRVGSLEPGKDADFVVWSGHPLDSTSVVEQTWIDGVKVFDRDEHVAAMKRNAEMKAALIQKVLSSGEPAAEPGENDPRPGALWPRHDEFCHDGHDHD
jgi:N-acetylglucosamine-6-phosphate deacetylase